MPTAIITGGSRGIGRGIVEHLASVGYDIAFSYHSRRDEAEAVRNTVVSEYGVRCACFEAHLEQNGAPRVLFDQCVRELNKIDLLVNNAGATIFESILELSEKTLDMLIGLDFKAYLQMMSYAARHMVRHGVRGSIINITSSRSQRAYPGDALYGGVKAGLNRAIESAALDVAPYGIRINNIAPGAIRIRTHAEIKRDLMNIPETFWDDFGKVIPLERSGLPGDIAQAVEFLASDKASYITGVTLRIDGGLILPGMPETPVKDGSDHGWGYSKQYFDDEEN